MDWVLITDIIIHKKGRAYTDMGVQGHDTCCWGARTWNILLGCKNMTYIVGVQVGTCCSGDNAMVHVVGVQEHDIYCWGTSEHMLFGGQRHGTCCWGART